MPGGVSTTSSSTCSPPTPSPRCHGTSSDLEPCVTPVRRPLGSAICARGELVPFLEPYADQLLVAPVASLVFDAADSVRGMLLAVLDRLDDAITCFEAASAVCERAGDVPHGVMNADRLAKALVAWRPG